MSQELLYRSTKAATSLTPRAPAFCEFVGFVT
jgi:hypothetical protein